MGVKRTERPQSSPLQEPSQACATPDRVEDPMDLSFAAWMAPDVPEEDEDTASSSTSKEQSCDSGPDELVDVQVSEDLLMCDEEISECSMPQPKRQRTSKDATMGFNAASGNPYATYPPLPWASNVEQLAEAWYVWLPHMLPTFAAPQQMSCMPACNPVPQHCTPA